MKESTDHLMERIDLTRLPKHVAIIMDGNGRWAQQRLKERNAGHSEGVNSVNRITRMSSDLGIKDLTLYAFSTENWNRPESEVDTLMHLIGWTILKETPELKANNVHIRLIGDIGRLPEEVQANLMQGVEATRDCDGLNLNLCLSYSSRWELVNAVRGLADDAAAGRIKAEDIDEDAISSRLCTAGIPDPDLLIRTGGELRISNFLLWQAAYSEFYFTPVLWPDFDREEYAKAIIDYQNRERRFGKTGEQVRSDSRPAGSSGGDKTQPNI